MTQRIQARYNVSSVKMKESGSTSMTYADTTSPQVCVMSIFVLKASRVEISRPPSYSLNLKTAPTVRTDLRIFVSA